MRYVLAYAKTPCGKSLERRILQSHGLSLALELGVVRGESRKVGWKVVVCATQSTEGEAPMSEKQHPAWWPTKAQKERADKACREEQQRRAAASTGHSPGSAADVGAHSTQRGSAGYLVPNQRERPHDHLDGQLPA